MTNHLHSDSSLVPDFVTEFLAQQESFSRNAELQEWLRNDPNNRRILDEYSDLWQGSLKNRNKEDYNEQKAWEHLHESLPIKGQEKENTKTAAFLPVLKGAAAAAIAALIISIAGYFGWRAYDTRQHPLTYSEYSVPYGSKSRMMLPDSSVAWLNAGSKLVISSQYGIRNREINLVGEAHFTVVPAQKPFKVMTSGLTIEALGTVFNVKAYPEEKTVETTVEEGEVKISRNHTGIFVGKSKIISINQRAIYNIVQGKTERLNPEGKSVSSLPSSAGSERKGKAETGEIKVARINSPEIYTSWKDEKWIIEREELQHLAVKLERRFNVRIIFRDEELKKYVFSGVLKDETLEQVLEAIKLTAPIGYKVQHDQVLFYELNTLKSRHH
jgi:ferric-dicitrate binding protein FerR (iron transport regulator)